MPASSCQPTKSPRIQSCNEFLHAFKDHEFDQVYPEAIRNLSITHWSPVNVCRMAAKLLVTEADTKVLDIGCGPGKFCLIGATTTCGHFTGVEQREKFVRTARGVADRNHIPRVEFVHGNITGVDFRSFDAFYLFNPFEENILPVLRIDYDVDLKPRLYSEYTAHVRQQLKRMPLATRVVTYCGCCSEIPECYVCEKTAFDGKLKLWVKKHPASACATRAESCLEEEPESIPVGVGGLALA